MLYIIRFILRDGREMLSSPVTSNKVAEKLDEMNDFVSSYSLEYFMEYPL